jgi:ribA/ribD-fused uncharacterized protein
VYPKRREIFFYGGLFSQWASCKFHSVSLDLDVNCAEQAMMLHKAKLFNDQDTFDCILKSDNPRVQKAMGKQIKNYNDDGWAKVRLKIVSNNNYDKFSQCPAWKELLLMTVGFEIIEASPSDRIWGIGYGEDSPYLNDRSLWGQNLLGQAIMRARTQIGEELGGTEGGIWC